MNDIRLTEYPRPQLVRESYLSLNGPWDFEMDQCEGRPNTYSRQINVPFAVETPLSGVGLTVTKKDVMHYRKRFALPEGFNRGRAILHLDAVDQVCEVFLNGEFLGRHEGGYIPFSFELKGLNSGENELTLTVWDDTASPVYPKGKQKKSGGIWYTPTSGIWQSVWLESVPTTYVKNLGFDMDIAEKTIGITAQIDGQFKSGAMTIFKDGKPWISKELDKQLSCSFDLKEFLRLWSPEVPYLYDIEVKVNDDVVRSYFAMREIGTIEKDGFKYVSLNGKPIFLTGMLDQGYWPDGGLTPPSDEAMMKDIRLAKSLGFNMLRKHIKIEPLRWYHHCDKEGIVVFQDMVNFGGRMSFFAITTPSFFEFGVDDFNKPKTKALGANNPKGRKFFLRHLEETVAHLKGVPSICGWTIFNEGWGQFETKNAFNLLTSVDKSRLIDANSGWFDQGLGDFNSKHIYFHKLSMESDGKRILSLSEYGGYSLRVKGHTFSRKNFGYKMFKDEKLLSEELVKLLETQVKPLIKKAGLSVAVLTQLSDVEQETNGMVTYDREYVKADLEAIKKANENLKNEL